MTEDAMIRVAGLWKLFGGDTDAAMARADGGASRDEIREALSGNICRCTGYGSILRGLEGLAAGE